MRKAILSLLLLPLVLCALLLMQQRGLAAEKVSVKELTETPEDFDGQTVTIEGEVIGDLMRRGDVTWITVNDDPYVTLQAQEERLRAGFNIGIGVWLPTAEANKVKVLGGYKNVGDRVSVTGVFHRADPEHGGDTDIAGDTLVVLEPGQAVSHPMSTVRWTVVGALAILALVLLRIRRARIRKALS